MSEKIYNSKKIIAILPNKDVNMHKWATKQADPYIYTIQIQLINNESDFEQFSNESDFKNRLSFLKNLLK